MFNCNRLFFIFFFGFFIFCSSSFSEENKCTNQDLSKCHYKSETNLLKNGKYIEYHSKTPWYEGIKKEEGTLINGIKNGPFIKWNNRGQQEEVGLYKNGKLEGLWNKWNWCRKIEECTYKDGNKDGMYLSWDLNGKLVEESSYANGKKEGRSVLYYPNGQKKEEANYKKDLLDGKYIKWWINGIIKEETIYQNGNFNGEIKWY
jgi:antitoxin component YwqK of YwqJK toxin-antitoxin module